MKMGQEESLLFRALYEDYLVPLKKLAVSMGIPYDDIEDLVHETLLTYYDKYPLDWSDKQKKAMLIRILHNKFIDGYRKNSHCADLDMEDSEEAIFALNGSFEKDVLSSIVQEESYQKIRKLIDELKPDWRDVIILYIVEEHSIKEICEILEISGTVCRSRIARARKYLKEKIMDSNIL